MQTLPVTAGIEGYKTIPVVIFNPGSLKELCDATGEPLQWLVENLCGPFIEDALAQCEPLALAIRNNDSKKVENIAHRLKGSSGSTGAMALLPFYQKLMDAGREHKLDGMEDVLSELRICLDYGKNEVEQMNARKAS
jgi:HPt (histidine-containing phosphotransfer) domain-containing protein